LAPGQKARFTFENPLFVSNPVFPTNTQYDFPELPGAKKEIENILQFSGEYTLLEGAKATKQEVMNDLRKCDVAYFATHGIANEKRPMDSSFLVLSGNTNPFLTAQDVVDMRDSTFSEKKLSFPEMVILSACQTGLGKSMEAGVAGLARSFMMAGANHIIMSLWNVDDDATAYLMNRFVYYLRVPGLHIPTEPLRLAALDTRQKFKDPSQWASFSVFGIDY
jgi:CHAT domain-containing protein